MQLSYNALMNAFCVRRKKLKTKVRKKERESDHKKYQQRARDGLSKVIHHETTAACLSFKSNVTFFAAELKM